MLESSAPRVMLTDLFAEEVAEALALKPFQGRQIVQWLHRKQVFDFEAMTDLSKDLRSRLEEKAVPAQLKLLRADTSRQTGTKKMLFELLDGETVESVYLVDRDRVTLCVSSQAGCPLACRFCATGQSGFCRDLSPGEIVEQVLHLIALEPLGERTPNIVYMGMGEPFRNYEAVIKSIRLLMMKEGLHIGARKITVSTVGDIPGIRRFAREGWQVRLAISLHAANDALRSELVPLNRTYPLAKLMKEIRKYASVSGRQISFEWTLLDGINDSPKDAAQLADLIAGIQAMVNLIPYNPVEGIAFAPSPKERCEEFRDALLARGVQATLRQERGQDIDAACGQLRVRHASAP